MTRHKTRQAGIWTAMSTTLAIVACTGANAHQHEPSAPQIIVQQAPSTPAAAGAQELDTIDHVVPARDSVGPAPAQFRWTAAKDADEYSIGIWNEVDRLVWRRDHITATATERPKDLELEAGTYFWTIAALRGGRQIADSGLAAFVVRTPEP